MKDANMVIATCEGLINRRGLITDYMQMQWINQPNPKPLNLHVCLNCTVASAQDKFLHRKAAMTILLLLVVRMK